MVECNSKSRRLIVRQTCQARIFFLKVGYSDPTFDRGLDVA